MTATATSLTEARAIAATFRRLFGHDGWKVEIVHPLFDGDLFYINVA